MHRGGTVPAHDRIGVGNSLGIVQAHVSRFARFLISFSLHV